MPGTTATQGLTYPVQTDRVVDHPTHLQVLASQVTAKLAAHTTDVARSVKVPAAVMRWNPLPATDGYFLYRHRNAVPGQNIMIHNEVLVDTDNMCDLSRDSRTLFIRHPGYYMCGFYLALHGGQDSNDTVLQAGITIGGGSNAFFTGQYAIPAAYDANHVSFATIERVTTADTAIYVNIWAYDIGGGVNDWIAVSTNMLWAYWIRDL